MKNRFSIALFLTIIMTNIILYFFLPLSIVTKWDFNGTPTSTMDKSTFVIVNIIICSFLFFVFLALSKVASNQKFLHWIGNTMLLFLFLSILSSPSSLLAFHFLLIFSYFSIRAFIYINRLFQFQN